MSIKRAFYYAFLLSGLVVQFMVMSNGEPFWYDESFSYVVAKLPYDRLIEATAGDVHPPFYYLLLHDYVADYHGDSIEVNARALSFLFNLMALLAFSEIVGKTHMTTNEEDIAFLLAVWLPSFIFFGAEARMYSLLSCLVLWSVVLLWNDTSPSLPIEIGRHALAGVFVGLACLTHNTALLYAPVIALSAFVYRVRRGDVPKWAIYSIMICAGFALLVYAPWLGSMLSQLQATGESGYWNMPPGLGGVAYNLYMSLFYGMTSTRMAPVAMLMVAAMTTGGAVLMLRDEIESFVMVAGVVILMYVVSHLTGTGVMLHRAMVPLSFFVVIGWAKVLSRNHAAMVPVGAVLAIAAALFIANGRHGARYGVYTSLPVQNNDIVYANNSASTPLLVYTDLPVFVAYQGSAMATGLSRRTLNAIGTPMARLEDLQWTRAWYMWFDVPYTTDGEREYRHELIERYHGALYYSNADPFFNSEIWLLTNNTP